MMKKTKLLWLLSLVMFVTMNFTACSDDEDQVGDVTKLYGLWEPTHTEGYEMWDGEKESWNNDVSASNDYDDYQRIEFFDDDSFVSYDYLKGTWKKDVRGTFQLKGNKIILDGESDYASIVSLSASQLVLESKLRETDGGIVMEVYFKVTYRRVN